MSEITINMPQVVVTTPAPVEPQVSSALTQEQAAAAAEASVKTPLSREERIPANWSIHPVLGSDDIVALCDGTGRTFSGSRESFSKFLKG